MCNGGFTYVSCACAFIDSLEPTHILSHYITIYYNSRLTFTLASGTLIIPLLGSYVGIVYSFSQNIIGCEYYSAFFLVSVSKKEKGRLNGTIHTHVCRFTSAKLEH